jgi:hypothetical protein
MDSFDISFPYAILLCEFWRSQNVFNAYTTDVEVSMSVGSQDVLTQKSVIFLNP